MKATGLTLNGRKLFVPDAAVADFSSCGCPHGWRSRGIVVPSNAKGLRITNLPAMDATRKLYEVTFDNVAAELLAHGSHALRGFGSRTGYRHGGPGGGNDGRNASGCLRSRWSMPRRASSLGARSASFQAVQHQCADMLGVHRELALGRLLRRLCHPGRNPGSAVGGVGGQRLMQATRTGRLAIAPSRCTAEWVSLGRTTFICFTGEPRRRKWRSGMRRFIERGSPRWWWTDRALLSKKCI